MRGPAKLIAERALLLGGAAALGMRRHRADTIILAYHDIVPHGAECAGDVSLHLPQASFAAQLDALRASHDIVPLEAALAPAREPVTRPRAAITFDDAYVGAVTAGVAELARRGVPATIFVPPGLLGGEHFWWDVLAPAGGNPLDPAVRARGLDVLAGRNAAILADARATATLPPTMRSATEAELAAAAATPGITLGSHTWSHPNLAALDDAELRAELERPLSWLRDRFPDSLPVLTYPYGLFSPRVQRAVQGAGYRAALRIDGGWVGRDATDPFAIPRLDVPSAVSSAGFRLRVAGVVS